MAILHCLCCQTVVEYTLIPIYPINTQIIQPRGTPQPLRNLAAALVVCRRFYDIIHRVMVFGSTIPFPHAMEELQNRKIRLLLSDRGFVITVPSQLSAIVNQIGYFWNNQYIDKNIIKELLDILPYPGITMLIPYFASLFRRNSSPETPGSIRLRLDDDDESSIVFAGTNIIHLDKWVVTNIQRLEGFVKGGYVQGEEGLVSDITRSAVYSWFSLQSLDDPLGWWAIKYNPNVILYVGPLYEDEPTKVTW